MFCHQVESLIKQDADGVRTFLLGIEFEGNFFALVSDQNWYSTPGLVEEREKEELKNACL